MSEHEVRRPSPPPGRERLDRPTAAANTAVKLVIIAVVGIFLIVVLWWLLAIRIQQPQSRRAPEQPPAVHSLHVSQSLPSLHAAAARAT